MSVIGQGRLYDGRLSDMSGDPVRVMGGVVRSKSASASHQYADDHCYCVAQPKEEISCVIADSQVKRFSISVNALSDNPRRFCWTRKAGGVWEWEWEGVGAECVCVRVCACVCVRVRG